MTIRRAFVGGVAAVLVPMMAFAAGIWTTVAPLQFARIQHQAAELNGKVYVAGSKDANGNPLPTEVYNSTTNTWSSLPSVGNVSAGVLAAVNGKLYYVGGCLNSNCNSPTAALSVFDSVSNTWQALSPMPTARGDIAGGVINGKLYITTGVSDSSGVTPHPELAVYDPATNTWSLGAPIPIARRGASAVVLNNKLYIIGGGTPTSFLADVSVYDPTTGTWGTDTPLPEGISQATASVLNGKIHLLGGDSAASSQLNTNWVFDPATHAWSADVPMPTARLLLASATANNIVYAIGGLSSGNILSTVETFTEAIPSTHPASKDACKRGGWRIFTGPSFKNQGQCVSWVNHSI